MCQDLETYFVKPDCKAFVTNDGGSRSDRCEDCCTISPCVNILHDLRVLVVFRLPALLKPVGSFLGPSEVRICDGIHPRSSFVVDDALLYPKLICEGMSGGGSIISIKLGEL